MRALAIILLAGAATAAAQTTVPVVISPRPATVISPLTPAPSASGQQLLQQIRATQSQRLLNHQLLTTGATQTNVPVLSAPTRVTVRPAR